MATWKSMVLLQQPNAHGNQTSVLDVTIGDPK